MHSPLHMRLVVLSTYTYIHIHIYVELYNRFYQQPSSIANTPRTYLVPCTCTVCLRCDDYLSSTNYAQRWKKAVTKVDISHNCNSKFYTFEGRVPIYIHTGTLCSIRLVETGKEWTLRWVWFMKMAIVRRLRDTESCLKIT